MRLWSIHPSYLDVKGLVALWREGLLAQKVLLGQTRGYKNHPQLLRFKNTSNPVGVIASYLRHVFDEAEKRGYNFDKGKIVNKRFMRTIAVTSGQLEFEIKHLQMKLRVRAPEIYKQNKKISRISPHPVFTIVNGNIEDWEII